MKKTVVILILITVVAVITEYIYVRNSPNAFVKKFDQELTALAERYEGEFVDSQSVSLRYQPLFWYGLSYMDARNGVNGCAFYIEQLLPALEEGYLAYYRMDAEVEKGLMFSDLSEEAYTIDQLGINGKGYRIYRKINDNWLHIRSYIPT